MSVSVHKYARAKVHRHVCVHPCIPLRAGVCVQGCSCTCARMLVRACEPTQASVRPSVRAQEPAIAPVTPAPPCKKLHMKL